MNTFIVAGYNIVGDGTPAALLPILTGQTERELPEARRGRPGAEPVDRFPWIWNKFKGFLLHKANYHLIIERQHHFFNCFSQWLCYAMG